MERKIGEIFEYNGEWYQCTIGNGCGTCAFNERKCYTFPINNDPIGECCADRRKDNKDVIFKKLEKVGEPVVRAKRPKSANNFAWFPYAKFQKYKVSFPVILPKEPFTHFDEDKGIVYIEIKQSQEDMEEKNEKLSNSENIGKNLKPFDLEAAKSGNPVCTRDGRKARIVCFDRKGYNMFPIVALIMNGDRESDIYTYRPNGTWYNSGNESDKDLMMLPEKKEGWVNVIKNQDNYYYCKGVFDTEEYASNNEANYPGLVVATVKIEWEE